MPVFGASWKIIDYWIIDKLFIGGLTQISKISGWALAGSGQVQTYIGILILAFVLLTVFFIGTGIIIEVQLDGLLK
jgi:hypothetical protein